MRYKLCEGLAHASLFVLPSLEARAAVCDAQLLCSVVQNLTEVSLILSLS